MKSESRITRFLLATERVGNALPHPAILFLIFMGITMLSSSLFSYLGVQAVHPIKGNTLEVVNLLSISGLHSLLNDCLKNFTGFAPLGTVLVAMLGFSLAEKSGLLSALLRLLILKSPRFLIVPTILLAGLISHTASDIGYILLIPLAALLFFNMGMHPLAGLAICFAGVSGGFAANFLLSTADTLLSGLSQEAARIIDPEYVVTPVSNWYFMAASSMAIIGIGTFVAHRVTIPFLGKYQGAGTPETIEPLNAQEKQGLLSAGVVFMGLIGLLLWGLIPENGFLREIGTGKVLTSPAIKAVVPIIFIFGALTGIAYGRVVGTLRSQNQIIEAMQEAMATMAPYLVLVFFAAQFIAVFNSSNLGVIMAIHGSDILKQFQLSGGVLMVFFVIFVCVLDFVVSSASAKWALIAPVFVPMFMLLGYSPELTQASYRIGDSVVNIISPVMSYFPLILAFANKYDPKAKVGTIMALMLPYTIAFLAFWLILLFLWISMGWPLGPGAGLLYE